MNTIAVLTGDIVRSTRIEARQLDAAMRIISASAADLSVITSADSRFTRFRGDGWQFILHTANLALRATLLVLADLRAANLGVETRISVGIGRHSNLGTKDLSDASGSAFVVSGRSLDEMPGHRKLSVAGGGTETSRGVADRDWQLAIFDLAEWISSHWTQPQAKAMAMALRLDWRTHDDLAQRLGITRQAIHARLTGAGFRAMTSAIVTFEKYEWDPSL